jgi:protein-disulfide isomerase
MKKIAAKRTDIVFFLKIFLLNPTPESTQLANSIVCSRSEAVLHNAYENKTIPKQECGTREVEENIRFAAGNGIVSAPALIFPDGSIQFGYSEAATLEKTIDESAAKKRKNARQ